MTDYLRLAQERAPQAAEEQDNPYMSLAQEQQNLQQNRARTVLESALKDDPDLAAERLRVSKTSGVPLRVVERNLDELRVKERARAIDLVSMAQDSPVLYRQITDPTFATTSVDDLDTLKNLERSVGKGVRYVMGADGKGGLPSDLVDATKTVGLGATVGIGKMAFDAAGVVNDLIGWDKGAADARGTAKQLQGVMDRYGFQPESSTGQAVRSGLQSAGTNLALLPLGLYRGLYATANQAASTVAGVMAAGVGASAYNEARDQGRNSLQAGIYAIPQATFEYVFERIPAAKLFGDIAANTGLLKTIGRQTLSEGWTEQVTTLAQDFNEWMNLNPDKTLAQFINERPEAAYQTFIATMVGVGVQTSTIKGINKIIEKATDTSVKFDQDLLESQMQLAAQSMLRQRSPEQFRTHVQRVVDENDGAKKEIYVDGEVLNQLPQELLAQLPESVREQIPGALETNSTVAISMADVLTVAPGTELEQILNDNARMRPNAASRVEAELTNQYLQQEAQRVLQQAQDQSAWQQSSESVKQTVLDQLNSTGRFTPDVNEAYATLQANFFSTMAARAGMTPQELYDRYSLKVAAKQVGRGDQYDQTTGELVTDTPAFKTWFGASKVADENGTPIVLYHGAKTGDITQFNTTGGKGKTSGTGLFLSPDPTVANTYTPRREGGSTYPVYVSLQNPLIVDFAGKNWNQGDSEAVVELADGTQDALLDYFGAAIDETVSTDDVARLARERGHDGVIIRNVVDNGAYDVPEHDGPTDLYVAFEPTQVKSVFNQGTFDATDPNMLNQAAVAEETEQDKANSLNEMRVSPRLPTAKKATEDALGETRLQPDLETAKRDPVVFEHNINLMAQYPNFQGLEGTAEEKAEAIIQHAVDNLLWLHDHWAPEYRDRSKMWYVGGNRIAHRWAERFDVSPEQVAAVIAATSPQKDWFQNVSLAERILEAVINNSQVPWDSKMSDLVRTRDWGKKEVPDPTVFEGKTLRDLYESGTPGNLLDMSIWIRAWDEANNPMKARVITPEGGFTSRFDAGKSGKEIGLRWQSFPTIAKTLQVLMTNDRATLSQIIGANHKVRSFYNNIIAPYAGEDVTIDTHAVAAALLRPLGSSSTEVYHNFGSGEPGSVGPKNSAITGLYGTYAIYAEAYRRAAQERGILPREMQSITWEAVRGLFRPEQKNEKIRAESDRIWSAAASGEINGQDARTQIEKLVGGIVDPAWVRSVAGADEAAVDSSYAGELPQAGVPRGGAQPVAGGARGDAATGNQGPATGVLNQQARGTFSPEQLLVTLNENADLSTFLHESGHFFLEAMADLASQPNAPQQIQDDIAATLKWFGVPDLATWNSYTLDEKRPYHEKWAESFEQYLFEGKAPSEELQPLFRRFRSWLVNVYKSLTQFMRARNLKLNDEVRQVFDRMIATDEQIAQAEEAAGMLPDFEATNEAIEQLQARSLRDLKWTVKARGKALKALEKQTKELRKGVEAEVRAEVEKQPLYAAMNWLRKGEMTNEAGDQVKAEKGFRLNTQALAEMYPESMLARPDLTRLKGMTVKDGLHPDLVADMFGFESGDQLVRAVIDAEPIASVIEGMTDQRMLERHGDLATPEAREAAANEAVHNEARARSLATELKSQAEMLNPRQDTGRTATNGRAITVNAITAASKQFAENLAARRRVKDLKSATWQHRSAEARAGKAWQAATAKGDTQAAVQAKRDQVLNNATVKALQDAQAEVKKIVEFFKRVTKGTDEKIVERGRDPDVVNAMRAILGAYDVAPRLEKSALAYMEAVSRNDPAMYAALKPSVDTAMLNAKPLIEMTMEELRGLTDELRAMWALAKRSRQMEVDGNLMDIEDAADELVTRMGEIGIPDTIPGETGAITDKQERGIKLQFAKAILSRVEQWSERLDGKFGGPFLRLVFQPVKDAADRYRTDKVAYRKQFTELLQAVAPSLPPGPIAAPELGYTFGNARDSGAAELLHAILHTGNDSNKRKLLLGRGWATQNADGTIDTTQWDAFIQRMQAEGKLTQAHYDFAQGVWDLLEQMKPLAQETHRKVFGRYFAEVTANEFTTPFGTYRGGYVPAQTDSRLVKDAKLRELAEGENESMAYAFPAAPSGFTKSRVEYNQPLLLDLRALGQHMDKVLLFSHMQGAVTDVRRLLTNKRVSYALDRIDPAAYEGMLIPWLNRSARQVVETPVVGDRGLARMLGKLRGRAGMALMVANLSNTVQQITGFSSAAVKVKPGLLLSATARFAADPKGMKTSVAEASPYMKDRMLNEVGAMNDAVEEILIDPTLLEKSQAWTQRHAYFMQAAVDNTMSPIIWTAAYNQAIEQKMDEKEAVRFADGVIRQTQGTTLPEDISRFETGPGYARLFTQFVSYFNMMANTNATAMKQIADEVGLRKGAGRLLYVALAGVLAPIWVAEAIAQAFRGGPDDKDKDGWLDDWLMAVFGLGTLRGLVAQVPLGGQLAQLVVNRFNDNPADDKFSLSPAVSLLESAGSSPASVYKAIVEDGNKQKAVRDVAAAATLITGLPIYTAARPLGYLAGMAGGNIEPTGPVDLARGLVTGTASPESKQR
jgi:ADP-Ribosyltransferase in polyvalent proteins/Large polyvalent protein associated domain 22